MKILYVTTSFTIKGDSAVIRNNALVKGLIENDCIVDVYTVEWPAENVSRFFTKEQNGKIHYSNLPSLSKSAEMGQILKKRNNNIINIAKKFVKSVLYYPDVCRQWKSKIKVENPSQYDIMISSSFCNSSHFAAEQIKKVTPSLFWIQIWGDPWYFDDLVTPWYLKPLVYIDENRLHKSADKIVYISKITADLMKKNRKNIQDKINYIPRSYYSPINRVARSNKKTFQITYAGNITSSTGRNIINFLNALSIINEENIQINIYSHIIDNSVRKQLISKSFVNAYPGVDYDMIPKIFADSDALLFISNKAGTSMIPGKIYDYLGTNLPIICLMADINDGVSNFIQSFGDKCIIIENETENIVERIPDIKSILGKTFPIVEDYSPKAIGKRFLHLYKDQ